MKKTRENKVSRLNSVDAESHNGIITIQKSFRVEVDMQNMKLCSKKG